MTRINNNWVITEEGKNYLKPRKAVTFAMDTETITYFKGRQYDERKLARKLKGLTDEQKRKAVSVEVWAWQAYDEENGFFMTNDFYLFLDYVSRCGYKFGWVYNSTFDFAQIDYQLLAVGAGLWKPHEKKQDGRGYDKGQAFTFESLHNDMGARYAYKIWYEYRNADRHKYVHAFELRDFMKLITGGLKRLLNDLDVRDNDGAPIRKLEMIYQAVDKDNLTDDEIAYCCNDVKGLYFAIKKFDKTIEEQSAGECHIFGKYTNIMTAGGFAKRMLLKSLYPDKKPKYRIEAYQRKHPISPEQDRFIRENHLYRGGVSFVNPRYKGRLLTKEMMNCPMYRYDVNSEYPYAMSEIRDLIGKPIKKTFDEYNGMTDEEREKYECIYVLKSVYGRVKAGMLGLWYDPFKKDFVETINEEGTHLMFEREFLEMLNWYDDVDFTCDYVLLCRKGDYAYRAFVDKNYALKAQAKKDKNATLQAVAKLLLNSSYGKLAERLERTIGHYELNPETGAIHFVRDKEETESKGAMSVLVGALVTSFARCYILSKIREVCAVDVASKFVYIDTDSIHAFASYDKADAFTLGRLKLEAVCDAIKYIAPKTYIDIEKVNPDGTIDENAIEIHSKGVNVSAFKKALMKRQRGTRKGKPTLPLVDMKMAYGAKYYCLVAMNVKGGKALLPTEKYLARPELAPTDGETFVYTNYHGAMFIEI